MNERTPIIEPKPRPEQRHNGVDSVPQPALHDSRRAIGGDGRRAADLAHLSPYPMAPVPPTPMSTGWGDAEQGGMGLQEIVAMLLRRRLILIVTFLTVVAIGTIITFLTRPVYQASASILVNTSNRSNTAMDSPILADLVGITQARTLDTQIEVLSSAPIREGAMRRLSPPVRQAAMQYAATSVAPKGTTDILEVSTASYSPQAAAALSDEICREYIVQSRKQNQSTLNQASSYVRGKLQTVGKSLADAQRALKDYKVSHGTVNIDAESSAQIAELGTIEGELRAAAVERAANVARINELRVAAARMAPAQIVPTSIVRRPEILSLRSQLTKLESDRIAALQEYNPRSSEVTNIEGQIQAIRNRLRQESQTEVSGWQRSVNPVREAMLEDIAKSQGEVWALEARSTALRRAATRARAALAQLPEREFRLAELTNEVASLQKTYQMFNEKFQTLRISEEASPSNARVVAPAQVPTVPISPRKGRNLMFSIALGLMLAIALAMLIDLSDDTIHTEEQAERATGRPVLAYVPRFETVGHRSLLEDSRKNSPLLESYRMLRTNIAFSALDEQIRSIVVTSSQPHEGKSTSSVNLAVVMALDGKQVILVDCDLRRPSLHRILGLPNDVGFSSVVAGTHTLEAALQPIGVPNLRILTAGPLPPNPPELLNSRAGRACLQQIMETADLAIIDTPPALAIADAQIVAGIADATLLIISSQEAGQREIRRTCELLTQTGTKLLGTVLNKIISGAGGYGYYGYYGNKYGYQKYYGTYIDAPEKNGKANGSLLQKASSDKDES